MTPSPSPTSLRERNKSRTRQDLLAAVLELCERSGVSGCTVNQVADRAGCSKATVYTYFPGGVAEMLQANYAMLGDDLLGDVDGGLNGAIGPLDRIMVMADALLRLAAQPVTGRFFALVDPSLNPVLEPVHGRTSSRYRDLVATELEASGVGSSASMATLLVGAMREASVAVAHDPSRHQPLSAALRELVAGLVPDPTSTTSPEGAP